MRAMRNGLFWNELLKQVQEKARQSRTRRETAVTFAFELMKICELSSLSLEFFTPEIIRGLGVPRGRVRRSSQVWPSCELTWTAGHFTSQIWQVLPAELLRSSGAFPSLLWRCRTQGERGGVKLSRRELVPHGHVRALWGGARSDAPGRSESALAERGLCPTLRCPGPGVHTASRAGLEGAALHLGF